MAENGVERTETGVKKTGSWKEITRFGKKVEKALEEAGLADSTVEKFREWRPRTVEAEADVKKKTVEAATLEERKIESESQGVKEDLQDASEKMVEAGGRVKNGENPEQEIAGASRKAALPLVSSLVRFMRKIESAVYSAIMMRFNSFYLDTGDLSVNVRNRGGDYSMDVKVSGEEQRGSLKQSFEEERDE